MTVTCVIITTVTVTLMTVTHVVVSCDVIRQTHVMVTCDTKTCATNTSDSCYVVISKPVESCDRYYMKSSDFNDRCTLTFPESHDGYINPGQMLWTCYSEHVWKCI